MGAATQLGAQPGWRSPPPPACSDRHEGVCLRMLHQQYVQEPCDGIRAKMTDT